MILSLTVSLLPRVAGSGTGTAMATCTDNITEVQLDEAFVPGALLEEPLEAHTVEALRIYMYMCIYLVHCFEFKILSLLCTCTCIPYTQSSPG